MFDLAFEVSVSELAAITSGATLREFLGRLLARYGLKHAVYHAIALPNATRLNPVVILTYPEQWVSRYVAENYFELDPIISAAATSILPIDWAAVDKRGPGARKLFGEAAEFGLGRHGISFPIRGPVGDRALFTITCDASDAEWARLKLLYIRDFCILAYFVHGKALEFERGESLLARPLSPRERECLRLAAQGNTNKQVARKLGISERVVRAYFESARYKLQCLNRGHVLSKATDLRIIDPNTT